MADQRNGGIAWTDATWNPIRGCSKVSAGCTNCYAESMAKRFCGAGQPYEGLIEDGRWNGKVRLVPERLEDPLHWSRPRRVFVNSMSDLFHESVGFEQIAAIFAVMASCMRHTFQILTKRPERMLDFFRWMETESRGANGRYMNSEPYRAGVQARQHLRDRGECSLDEPPPPTEIVRWLYDIGAPIINATLDQGARMLHLKRLAECHWQQWPLRNVWIGVSVENQQAAEDRIPLLLETPAALRWISMEPLLGPVDLDLPRCETHGRDELSDDGTFCNECVGDGYSGEMEYGEWLDPLNEGIAWVVVGGESGPKARPMHPEWVRSLRDQCADEHTPFLFKQWGEWLPDNQNPKIQGPSGSSQACRVGKHVAGRLLDGHLHDEFPEVARG